MQWLVLTAAPGERKPYLAQTGWNAHVSLVCRAIGKEGDHWLPNRLL